MGYKDDLRIDEHNLDEECLRQPVLFEMYSQKLTPLYKLRDELKFEMEVFRAKLDGIIREEASAEGKKITEATILNEISRNVQLIDFQTKYLNICTEIKEGEVIRDAFLQRKEILKLLVELFVSQYWSSIETPIIRNKKSDILKNKLEQKIKEDKKINEID